MKDNGLDRQSYLERAGRRHSAVYFFWLGAIVVGLTSVVGIVQPFGADTVPPPLVWAVGIGGGLVAGVSAGVWLGNPISTVKLGRKARG